MASPAEVADYQQENLAVKQQIEERTGKTVEQLYAERAKRINDVIELRQPDRVPFFVFIDPHAYSGIPNSAAYYDPVALRRTQRQMAVDLEPDMCRDFITACGAAMTELDVRNCVWPGGPKPPDYGYQFIETENMKADEYDMFLNDPTGFVIRRYLPRVYGSLTPLAKLPPLDSMFLGLEALTPLFAAPGFLEMARHLAEAGEQAAEFAKKVGTFEDLAQLGFPPFTRFVRGGVGGAPFDTLTTYLRGLTGSMVDMYRQPEKLLKACELILERRIAAATPADPTERDYPPRVGMPLWRGDATFMSEAQFKKFFWPGLKKSLQTHVDLGYVPVPTFEAKYGDRLACMLELPKGRILASIEAVDVARAKEMLGGHTGLFVRCPNSSTVWSLGEVESYVKDLIDKYGRNGGIMIGIHMPQKARIDDMQAMLRSVKEYGRL
jgi:hypothetical protein